MTALSVQEVTVDGIALDFEADAGALVNLVGPPRRRQQALAVLAGRQLTRGRITLFDQDITEFRHDPRLSYAPQQTRIVESLTAAENVALPLLGDRSDRGDALARATELLSRLEVAAPMHHNLAGELSGGQRQRVCLARALITHPQLLIADDPASELDAASAGIVTDCLTELCEQGGIVLLGTSARVEQDCLMLSMESRS